MNHLFQTHYCNLEGHQRCKCISQQLHSEKLGECWAWRLPVCHDNLGTFVPARSALKKATGSQNETVHPCMLAASALPSKVHSVFGGVCCNPSLFPLATCWIF